MRGFVQFLLSLGIAGPGVTYAARPFVTDDARIVDPGGYQVESFVKRQRGFDEREFWFLPAHNPSERVELTVGGTWLQSEPADGSRALLVQVKSLLKALETNGAGLALTLGMQRLESYGRASTGTNPYVNGIASFSFAEDSFVLHANTGARRDGGLGYKPTWGAGAEVRLTERVFAIAETYGERTEKPTRHVGLRVWLMPNRVQVDTTLGYQRPEARFQTLGLRLLW